MFKKNILHAATSLFYLLFTKVLIYIYVVFLSLLARATFLYDVF